MGSDLGTHVISLESACRCYGTGDLDALSGTKQTLKPSCLIMELRGSFKARSFSFASCPTTPGRPWKCAASCLLAFQDLPFENHLL